jgi:hypothetical protein
VSATESAYVRWNEAVQKFDYYLVGIVGAGVVLLLRDLRIEHLGFTSDCVRATGVFCLLLSFIAGLIRLERFHMFLRFEHEKLVRAPYREAIKGGNRNIVRESDLKTMSPEEVDAFEAQTDANHARLQAGLASTVRLMGRAYSIRNWTLFIGLFLLFAGAFVPAPRLLPTTPLPSTPLPAPAVTKQTPPAAPAKPSP